MQLNKHLQQFTFDHEQLKFDLAIANDRIVKLEVCLKDMLEWANAKPKQADPAFIMRACQRAEDLLEGK